MSPAEKASFQGTQFNSKQCREKFVTPLSYFHQCRCNFLTFKTPVLLRQLVDLDKYMGAETLGVFHLFIKRVADIIAK